MNSLEQEISKYEKKGFKVEKRKLKYGSRTFLFKKKAYGFLTGEAVYIYYVDGIATTDSLSECFKDYEKYYKEKEGDFNIKGFFLCSGSCEEKLFKGLRATIRKDKIRNSIKLSSLGKPTEIETGKEQPTTEVKKGQPEKVSLTKVRNAIEEILFIPSEKEMHYETQVYQSLRAKGFDVVYERSKTGARFDLVVGKDEIAIEIKVIKKAKQLYDLIGQIIHYRDQFEKIIVLLIDELRNPSLMKQEMERIEELAPEKIIVIKK